MVLPKLQFLISNIQNCETFSVLSYTVCGICNATLRKLIHRLHEYLTNIKIFEKDQAERILNAGLVLVKRQKLTDANQGYSERQNLRKGDHRKQKLYNISSKNVLVWNFQYRKI